MFSHKLIIACHNAKLQREDDAIRFGEWVATIFDEAHHEAVQGHVAFFQSQIRNGQLTLLQAETKVFSVSYTLRIPMRTR